MSNFAPQQTYNQYKIRKITWNEFGSVYGISIPKHIAIQFEGVKFNITCTEDSITLTSGLDLAKLRKESNTLKIEDYESKK